MWSTRYSCQILIKLEFPRQIFEKYSNIKWHENLSSGSRVVPCGWTEMTKPIVAFRNFVNEPKTLLNNARISLCNKYFGELRSEKCTSGFQLRTSLRSAYTLSIRRHRRVICVSKKRLHPNNPAEQSNKGTRECVIAAIIQVRTFCSEVPEQPLLLASSGPARDFSCNSASHSSVRQIYTLTFYCWIANVTQIEACTCRLPFL